MKFLSAFLAFVALRDVTSFVPLHVQKSANLKWQRTVEATATSTTTTTTTTRLLDSSTPMDDVVQLDHEDTSKAIDPLPELIYIATDDGDDDDDNDEQEAMFDAANMRIAIQMAQSG